MQQLDLVREHMGLNATRRFTVADTVVTGSNSRGLSKRGATAAELAVQDELRDFFRQPQQNLFALLERNGLGQHFAGLDLFLKQH